MKNDHIPLTQVRLDIYIVRNSGEEEKNDKCSLFSDSLTTFQNNIIQQRLARNINNYNFGDIDINVSIEDV